MPIWSALTRSISLPVRPLQKLPPPMTMPISWPASTSWRTWPATIFTVSRSNPFPLGPASASPLSFRMILLIFLYSCMLISLPDPAPYARIRRGWTGGCCRPCLSERGPDIPCCVLIHFTQFAFLLQDMAGAHTVNIRFRYGHSASHKRTEWIALAGFCDYTEKGKFKVL